MKRTARGLAAALALWIVVASVAPACAMTLAKMQAVAVATTNAGFDTHAIPILEGTAWQLRVTAPAFTVAASAVSNLATAQNVSAFIAEAEFPNLTKAQAQTISTAITNAGLAAASLPNDDGTWRVRARASDFSITALSAANLAASNGVTVFVAEALFQ